MLASNDHTVSKCTSRHRGIASSVDLLNAFHHSLPDHRDKSDIAFVCIGCEAFEFDQAKVTEVGVAVADTRDLRSFQYFKSSAVVIKHIQVAYYRPVEYSLLVNKRFEHNCPDTFGFGKSTWVELQDLVPILHRIFQDLASIRNVARFEANIPSTHRDIVVVDHSLGNDDRYFQRLGFSLDAVADIVGQAKSTPHELEASSKPWKATSSS